MANPFLTKPTENSPESYVLGYLDSKLPEFYTLEKIQELWPKLEKFREFKKKLKDPWA